MGLAACFRAFGVASVLCLTGCASVQLQATQRSVEANGFARVEVGEVDGDILTFDVYNLSKLTLVVLRDKIVLETPTGRRGREPGGVQRAYTVAPGAMHDVKVKFDFSDCTAGTELKVRFDDALVADGAPLHIAPVPFVCR
jgi:hypothetical protein